MKFVLLILLGAGAMNGVPAATPSAHPLDAAVSRIYNLDFATAIGMLDSYTTLYPRDPLGHALRAAAFLFAELHRLDAIGKQTMMSDAQIAARLSKQPDPAARYQLQFSADKAKQIAADVLTAHPHDSNALLSLCIASGVQRDYAAMAEKKLRASLAYAQESQRAAIELLKADPQQYDAYFTLGFTDYLLGSSPVVVRWFMHFEGAAGTKEQGIRNLELAAHSGHYLKPFAEMMLALFYQREKRMEDRERMLRKLHEDFPENSTFADEVNKLNTYHKESVHAGFRSAL